MAIKKDTYYFKIDQVCSKCGYKNQLKKIMTSQMNVIGCGGCGDLLTIPNDIKPEERKIIEEIMDKTLKEVK